MFLRDFIRLRRKRTPAYAGCARQIGFIVGTGRCGTTILSQVLNAHSKICVPPEMQFVVSIGNGDRLFEKCISGELAHYKAADFITLFEQCCPYHFEDFFDYRRHFEELDYPQTNLKKILKDFYDHMCFDKGKEIFLMQTPWQGQKLDLLKELFPDMKVIHLVRDARDVAISFKRTPWWSDEIDANLLQWAREVEIIHDFGKENPDCFFELRYEDMILQPEEMLRKVLEFLGQPFEEAILRPENLIDYSAMFKQNRILKNIQSAELNKWKKKEVFFKGSVFAWKKSKEDYDFSKLPEHVRELLREFHYEA